MPRHLQTLQLVAVPPGTPSVPQSPTGYDFLNLNETKFCVKTVRILEKAEPKVLQCEKCERVFTSNSSLDYHIKRKVCEQVKTVMAGPPYVCDICSTSFELRQTWYAHVQRQACKKYPERYMNQDATDLEVNVKIETDQSIKKKRKSAILKLYTEFHILCSTVKVPRVRDNAKRISNLNSSTAIQSKTMYYKPYKTLFSKNLDDQSSRCTRLQKCQMASRLFSLVERQQSRINLLLLKQCVRLF